MEYQQEAWNMVYRKAELDAKLHVGEIVRENNRHYTVCGACHRKVRLDKPLLGGLHVCK